jgi:hypothetical protein
VGMAVRRFGVLPEGQTLPPLVPGSNPPASPDPTGPTPKLGIEQTEYDFGVMDLDAEISHDFTFTNTGEATLELTAGDTSCRCTLSEVDAQEIPPGESGHVTLTWHGNGALGPYRQTATIFANDPGRPRIELVVSGRVTSAARTVPDELVFTQVSAGEPATAEIPLYGYLEDPLEVTGFELDHPDTAEHFEVTFEPLPPALLEEEAEAKSGALVRVTVKPGLPLGPFRQTIRVRTSLADVPEVEIPVRGIVTSDIMVVGPNWDREHGLLDLGTVASGDGARRQLLLVARGPHRQKVSFSPTEVYPDLLRVELGETKPINNGQVFHTPLTIEIPKGSRPANHLGSEGGKLGTILLETGHPEAKQLRIRIRFAVKG